MLQVLDGIVAEAGLVSRERWHELDHCDHLTSDNALTAVHRIGLDEAYALGTILKKELASLARSKPPLSPCASRSLQ